MRYLRLALLVAVMTVGAACTPEENQGGTPVPGAQSGAPLNDEAIGPSEQPAEIDD